GPRTGTIRLSTRYGLVPRIGLRGSRGTGSASLIVVLTGIVRRGSGLNCDVGIMSCIRGPQRNTRSVYPQISIGSVNSLVSPNSTTILHVRTHSDRVPIRLYTTRIPRLLERERITKRIVAIPIGHNSLSWHVWPHVGPRHARQSTLRTDLSRQRTVGVPVRLSRTRDPRTHSRARVGLPKVVRVGVVVDRQDEILWRIRSIWLPRGHRILRSP